jgi:5-dehydro-4-deoxyglucarate dehydratase
MLDAAPGRFAEALAIELGPGAAAALAPGAGAAGGVGYAALAVLGDERRPGIDVVLELTGLLSKLAGRRSGDHRRGQHRWPEPGRQDTRGSGPGGRPGLSGTALAAIYSRSAREPDLQKFMANARSCWNRSARKQVGRTHEQPILRSFRYRVGIGRCRNDIGKHRSLLLDSLYQDFYQDVVGGPGRDRVPPHPEGQCPVTHQNPADLAARLKTGLLSFPVTHFDADLRFDEARYREHLTWQAGYDVAGLFAGGGTGEGFSLTTQEMDRVVRVAVDEIGGKVPVIASATGSTFQAIAQAKAAEAAGADGVLLMPPYLTEADQEGLIEHVSAVCRSTNLGVIVYSRANAVLKDTSVAILADRNPNLIGFKDGIGNIEQMTRIYAKVGERLTYIGGLPTAETFALPLLQLGVSTYSSAMFNFVPEFAVGFYKDVIAQDRTAVYRKLNDFVIPYLDIRDRVKGYGVSIVKAGLTAVGRPAGPVRPPLQDLTAADLHDLTILISRIS